VIVTMAVRAEGAAVDARPCCRRRAHLRAVTFAAMQNRQHPKRTTIDDPNV